jgi:hypothetical protein
MGREGSCRHARALALFAVLSSAALARQTHAQDAAACSPACGLGETCVSGTCMVPARPPLLPAPPAESATPAPAAPAPQAQAPEAVVPPPVPPPPPPPPAPAAATVPRARPVPAAAKAPLPERTREGRLILPYLGLHSFQGSNEAGLDPGLRLGVLGGEYVTNHWSMNGALELDILNPNDMVTGGGLDFSSQMLGLTFSPLYHAGSAEVEFVVGPKLGGFVRWAHVSVTDPFTGESASADGTAEGWTIGGNIGLFGGVSSSALIGVLFSLERRGILHGCASGTGIAEQCTSSGDSATILSFALGVLL